MSGTDDLHQRTLMAAGALGEHAHGELTRVSGLTDEEILALSGADDIDSFDLPWVTAREAVNPHYSRDEARLAALRSLLVRGGVTPENVMAAVEGRGSGSHPNSFTPSALLAGILARRMLAPYLLRISGSEEDRTTTMRVFVDHDGTVMHEVTSQDGLHHFFMSDLAHAVAGVRARVDPSASTAPSIDEHEVVTGDWSALEADAMIGPVLASATSRSLLRSENRRARVSKDIVIAVSPSATAVLQSGGSGEQLEAILASSAELDELVASLLRPETARD